MDNGNERRERRKRSDRKKEAMRDFTKEVTKVLKREYQREVKILKGISGSKKKQLQDGCLHETLTIQGSSINIGRAV